jgi:hypothetical protein
VGVVLAKLPKKFLDRVSSNLRKFQKIAEAQQKADVAEANTVTLVKDILAEVLGYDKWEELTGEHQIKSTYCDIAVKIAGQLRLLVEVKSAGTSLADNHLQQVINYGAHQGIHWLILTNAVEWRLVRIVVASQISHEVVAVVKFLELNPRKPEDMDRLFIFAREGLTTDAMDQYHQQSQLFSPYTVAAIMRSESVVGALRRELRRVFPDLKVEPTDLIAMLQDQVLKRETIEGDKAKEAAVRIKKAQSRLARLKAKRETAEA